MGDAPSDSVAVGLERGERVSRPLAVGDVVGACVADGVCEEVWVRGSLRLRVAVSDAEGDDEDVSDALGLALLLRLADGEAVALDVRLALPLVLAVPDCEAVRLAVRVELGECVAVRLPVLDRVAVRDVVPVVKGVELPELEAVADGLLVGVAVVDSANGVSLGDDVMVGVAVVVVVGDNDAVAEPLALPVGLSVSAATLLVQANAKTIT